MNASNVEYNLQNIFAQFAICLMIASREIIIIVINVEYVVLQMTRNIDTATFATRVLLMAISRTFAERTYFTTSAPSA
jgi:hypothetical protein